MTADQLSRAAAIGLACQFDRESGVQAMPIQALARYAQLLNCRPRDLVPDLPRLDATKSSASGSMSAADPSSPVAAGRKKKRPARKRSNGKRPTDTNNGGTKKAE